jgi:hypothetical protein
VEDYVDLGIFHALPLPPWWFRTGFSPQLRASRGAIGLSIRMRSLPSFTVQDCCKDILHPI